MSPPASHRDLHFEFWRSSIDQLWYWHLKVAHDQKVAQGEAYATKSSCLSAIELVKAASAAPIENLSPREE